MAEQSTPHVAVVGGGVGGLSAAIDLAGRGYAVCVFERAANVGGKLREVKVGGRLVDSGPTVVTMRWSFEELFSAVGKQLHDYVRLVELEPLARHGWSDGSALDLFADLERSREAIRDFSDQRNADGYVRFCAHAEKIYAAIEDVFLRAERPVPSSVVRRAGLGGLMRFLGIDWHRSMWRALGDFFPDPRLRQLFARYATYNGSSPFRAAATLNLIAHVERVGVWRVEGGMGRLADALVTLCEELGVVLRTRAAVDEIELGSGGVVAIHCAGERIPFDAVVLNAAPDALAAGLFGEELAASSAVPRSSPRSLSAVTRSMVARVEGFDLAHHTVFFSNDYPAEFEAIFERGEIPAEPTVYICAQDRCTVQQPGDRERLLSLVNAPARADANPFTREEIEACGHATDELLSRCGLKLSELEEVTTTPNEFEQLFPATGGALYGAASHGMGAPFRRPGARTKTRGLYLAGGVVHPGAGIPMACLSGRLAAKALSEDFPST